MKRIYFLIMSAFFSVMTMAQEGGGADLDVNITKTTDTASFPWLWVVGGIVLLVLLIALLGGRGGRDRVIERKTVVRE